MEYLRIYDVWLNGSHFDGLVDELDVETAEDAIASPERSKDELLRFFHDSVLDFLEEASEPWLEDGYLNSAVVFDGNPIEEDVALGLDDVFEEYGYSGELYEVEVYDPNRMDTLERESFRDAARADESMDRYEELCDKWCQAVDEGALRSVGVYLRKGVSFDDDDDMECIAKLEYPNEDTER